MTDLRDRAIALYDAFTHDHRDRRAFMKEMVALAGSVAAAEALVASIAAAPAAQQVTAEDPRRADDRLFRGPQGCGAVADRAGGP